MTPLANALILFTLKDALPIHLKPNVINASSVNICINLDYQKDGRICAYQPSVNASKCCLKFINEGEC